jgi:hypothetical protein
MTKSLWKTKGWPLLVCTLPLVAEAQLPLKSQIFGYIEGYVEKNEKTPTLDGGSDTTAGDTVREYKPHEYDTPNIVLMMKTQLKENYSAFLNVVSPGGEELQTRNAWVEAKIKGDHLKFRIGKLYRPFGLYNEILDAVPTFMGIEPPEIFDNDHLMLTRTTNMMLHGEMAHGQNVLRYSLTNGNDERIARSIPLGGDLRYTIYGNDYEWTIGTSYYRSGEAKSGTDLGEGAGNGGVATHMKRSDYDVKGFYTEFNKSGYKFQFEYWNSAHDATRNGQAIRDAEIEKVNSRILNRWCQGNCATATDSNVDYNVETWYFRLGKSIMTEHGEFLPYIQWDYYSNPEMAYNKDLGGDAEAGLADDGKFHKQTAGLVYRPIPIAAFKFDASNHSQKVNGSHQNYAEFRFSYSLIWSL